MTNIQNSYFTIFYLLSMNQTKIPDETLMGKLQKNHLQPKSLSLSPFTPSVHFVVDAMIELIFSTNFSLPTKTVALGARRVKKLDGKARTRETERGTLRTADATWRKRSFDRSVSMPPPAVVSPDYPSWFGTNSAFTIFGGNRTQIYFLHFQTGMNLFLENL